MIRIHAKNQGQRSVGSNGNKLTETTVCDTFLVNAVGNENITGWTCVTWRSSQFAQSTSKKAACSHEHHSSDGNRPLVRAAIATLVIGYG